MSDIAFVPVDQIFSKYTWYRVSPIYGPDVDGRYWSDIGAQGFNTNQGALAWQDEAHPKWHIAGAISYLFPEWFEKQMLPVARELSDPNGVELADPQSEALRETP
jgi:hypothetical protein